MNLQKVNPFKCAQCGHPVQPGDENWIIRWRGICDECRTEVHSLNLLSLRCRIANDTWWHDPVTGEKLVNRNKGELLALIHSEISECLEGERKQLMDDHLPHRKMAEVELADALIRIFDYAGEYGYDLGGAFEEKMKYNASRADHKPENRIKLGGKEF
jgi:NTP pyrophosphatase (non-canonical NTP hydrolase)